MSTSDISVRRKEAYNWIWGMIGNTVLFWDPPINSDRRLAEVFAESEEDIQKLEKNIRDLKEGNANPSKELIDAVKRFFNQYPDDIVEANLIKRCALK